MKKRTWKLLAAVLTFVLFVGCLTPLLDVSAREETNIIEDTFNKKETLGAFDTDVWTGYTGGETVKVTELAKPEKVIKCQGKNITAETNVFMTKEWYWEIRSISFDMWVPANADWAFIDFVDIDEPMDYPGDFGEHGEPMCYGARRVLPNDDFGLANTTWSDWGFGSDTIGDTWVSVKIVSQDATNGKIMLAPKGQAFDETKAQSFILAGNRSFYNSNFVFGDYKFSGYMLDNFVIETDTGTFKEDFEDDQNDLFEEIAISENTASCYPISEYGGSRKLTFENAAEGDRLISNAQIQQNDEHLKASDEVLNVSFSADFSKLGADQEIAYVFGMAENDALPFGDNHAFIMSKNRVRLSYFDMEGNETILEARSKNVSGKVNLTLTKGGTFTATVGGSQVFQYKGVENYAGYTGFAAKTAVTGKGYIDDVVIQNKIFDIITTKSWADDFSENRIGTGTNTDYAWNAEAGSIKVSGEEVVFEGCSDYTYFGPAYVYETYELSFQLTSILATKDENEKVDATYLGKWLGIDFGKTDSIVKTYGTYGMLGVNVTAPVDGSAFTEAGSFLYKVEGTSDLTGEVHTRVKPIPGSYFEAITYDRENKTREEISADDAVCFKFVALEDKVELYMKRAKDAEYTLYVTVENVDPKGYVALACTGYTYWTIDNFEIKNTAEIYNEAPEIVIEEKVLPTLAERGVGVEDTFWAREQKLNAERKGGVPVVLIAGIAAVVVIVGGVAGVVIYRKKKTNSNVETTEN